MTADLNGLSYDSVSDTISDGVRIETQYSLPNGDLNEDQKDLQDSGYCG